MAKTQPIARERGTSSDKAARKLLAVQSRPNAAPAKSAASNGNASVGGRGVTGGARVRGGRA